MPSPEEEAWVGATEPLAVSRPHGSPSHPRYEILDVLGRGGSGVVYRAVDRQLGLEVALKTLHAELPVAADKLKAEFRLRAGVLHPHLLPLYDLVVTDVAAFFTMELVAGPGLLEWVSGSVPRVASAARQLVSALAALHDAGLVHCDVKPDNVLVRGAHVFLGDFGLALPMVSSHESRVAFAGTPAYMAPERKRGAAPTKAADMYGVGATLAECLTGSAHGRELRDRELDPRLVGLVEGLLAAEPDARPTAHDALTLLNALVPEPAITVPGGSLRALRTSTSFVGREDALSKAFQALKGSDREGSRIVGVQGPSGIGKTTFAERALARLPRATLPLSGRCHPHEQVAFGVWQDVIEQLASEIKRTGHRPLAALGSDERAALGRLFPALASGASTAGAVGEGDLRRLAFAALKSVLGAFAHEQRTVVWLDDLHWADDDCVELLDSLLAGAGIPRCDFVLSYRPLGKESDRVAQSLAAFGPRLFAIELAPLSRSETKEILRQELRRAGESATDTRLEKLAESSNGFPIFAQVLARRESSAQSFTLPPGEDGDDLLSRLINDGVDAMGADERKLVDTVILAEGPMSLPVAAMASALGDRALSALVATEQMALLSRAPGSDVLRVVPYHDRVRQARIARLGPDAAAEIHRALVAAHEALRTEEYEALTHHAEATGDRERTSRYAELAGDRAAAALGFAAAASFYSRALESGAERAGSLEKKLADSLAAQGLGVESGTSYEKAAAHEVDRMASIHLKISAAEQFFHSARFNDGYRIISGVLNELGTTLPRSNAACLAQSMALRLRFIVRGHSFRAAEEHEISASERARLDALWTASSSLAHVSYALADVLSLRLVLGALEAGEPSRMLRSLAFAAATEAAVGGSFFDRRADRMFAEADRIAREVGGTYNLAFVEMARASTQFFRADFSGVIRAAERAEAHLNEHRFRITWERSINSLYWASALALSGRLDELDRCRELAYIDAVSRRDSLAMNHIRSYFPALARLFRDEVETARAEIADLLNVDRLEQSSPPRIGNWPEGSYSALDYNNLIAVAHLDLYEGRARDAYKRVTKLWPWLKSSLLLRVQFAGADLRYLLARSALAAAGENPRAMEKIAHREMAILARDSNRAARAYALLLKGVLDARHGSAKSAAAAFTSASQAFDAITMPIHAAATSFRAEQASGARPSDAALERLHALGVKAPDKVVNLFVPVL